MNNNGVYVVTCVQHIVSSGEKVMLTMDWMEVNNRIDD